MFPEMAAAPDWIAQLLLAADSFLFARPMLGRPDGRSVIAGYPWFGDWGRDTMVCLPGLALATGRLNCDVIFCRPSPALSIAECCPMSSRGQETSPITIPPTPRYGFLRHGAPISRRAATA